jgi:hypothetical protein
VGDKLLEFRGGFRPLVSGHVGLATKIDRIERPVITVGPAQRHAQLMGRGCAQRVDRFGRLAMVQRDYRADVARALATYCTKPEIEAVMARRDAIVKVFDDRIRESGEAAVLYDLHRIRNLSAAE